MNWLFPRYCSSTAEPWLPQIGLVLTVLGWVLMEAEKMPPSVLPTLRTAAANLPPSADIHAPDQYWLVVVRVVHEAPWFAEA